MLCWLQTAARMRSTVPSRLLRQLLDWQMRRQGCSAGPAPALHSGPFRLWEQAWQARLPEPVVRRWLLRIDRWGSWMRALVLPQRLVEAFFIQIGIGILVAQVPLPHSAGQPGWSDNHH